MLWTTSLTDMCKHIHRLTEEIFAETVQVAYQRSPSLAKSWWDRPVCVQNTVGLVFVKKKTTFFILFLLIWESSAAVQLYWVHMARLWSWRIAGVLCEQSPAGLHISVELQLLQRDVLMPELSHGHHWVCSGTADLRGKTAIQQRLGERGEKWERSGLAGTKVSPGKQ